MFFWKNRPLVISIILAIVLIVMLFATSGHNTQDGYNSIIGNVIAPLQEGLYDATDGIGGFFTRLFSSTDFEKENLELHEKVAELESQLRDYENILYENEHLKELLNVKDSIGDYDLLTANVIAKNSGEWFEEFTINAGTEDGVQKDMIVLTNEGLMGKVVSAAETYSKVITLVNTTNGVPAMVERTRDYGVIKPFSGEEAKKSGLLSLEYLSEDADIVPGDRIITSGMGGLYPKGIYIGVVSEVSTESGDNQAITVQSSVDFKRIEEVIVVLELFTEVEE